MSNEDNEELPGMLELAKAIAEQRWPQSIDAETWADEWLKTIREHPEVPTDKGAMIGWFANAIMAGYDTAQHRNAYLITALQKLANEAASFLSMADRQVHGNTNMSVLALRIEEGVTALLKVKGHDPAPKRPGE